MTLSIIYAKCIGVINDGNILIIQATESYLQLMELSITSLFSSLIVIMFSAILISAVKPSVIILSVSVLCVTVMSANMLNITMLSV